MKFPEFIIAGFGRCGTSALLLNLGQHPDIQISIVNGGTETRFWNAPPPYIEEHLDEYKQRFFGKCSGEKTPGYSLRPYSMQNIHKYIPDTKIILCLRNPVERALSHYDLHKRFGRVPKDEGYEFNKHKLVINEGVYIRYIKVCIEPFVKKENLYFHVMEWAKEDLNASLSKIYKFLECSPYKTDVKKINLKSDQRGESHYVILFENNDSYHIWSQKRFTKIPSSEMELMYEYFEPHNRELFDFLGYEIKEWTPQRK